MIGRLELAVVLAGIASIVEFVGSYALVKGKIKSNLHAILMTFSGIIAMWVAIILAWSG